MKKLISLFFVMLFVMISSICCAGKINNDVYELKNEEYLPSVMISVSSAEMIKNMLYFADRHRIMSYNVVTGVESVFADNLECCENLTSYGDKLYAFDSTEQIVIRYSDKGKTEEKYTINLAEGVKVNGFTVTEDYIIFTTSDFVSEIIQYDMKNGVLETLSIPGYSDIENVECYGEESLILVCEKNYIEYISIYDLKSNEIIEENVNNCTYLNSVAYNSKNNRLYAARNSMQVFSIIGFSFDNAIVETISRTSCVMEGNRDITSEEYIEMIPLAVFTYGNVVGWFDCMSGMFRFFDIENTSDILCVATSMQSLGSDTAADVFLYEFEKNNGIRVKEIFFNDEEELKMELLSGEEVDIYLAYQPEYVNSNVFVDLNSYKDITECITKNKIEKVIKKVASKEGSFFGVPIQFRVIEYCPIDRKTVNSLETFKEMIYYDNIQSYLYHFVDFTISENKDKDFSKLKEMLTWLERLNYEDMDSSPIPYYGEYDCFASSYLVLNPTSKNKIAAVEFLKEAIDFYSGSSSVDYEKLDELYLDEYKYSDIELKDSLFPFINISKKEVYDHIPYNQISNGEITVEEKTEIIGSMIETAINE